MKTECIYNQQCGKYWAKVIRIQDGTLRYNYGDGGDLEFCFSLSSEIGEIVLPMYSDFFNHHHVRAIEIPNRPYMADVIEEA